MYFYKGSLVGIQNPDLHPSRVVRYFLNPQLDAITRAEVLETYNPLFEIPTTGTLVDDALFHGQYADRQGETSHLPNAPRRRTERHPNPETECFRDADQKQNTSCGERREPRLPDFALGLK